MLILLHAAVPVFLYLFYPLSTKGPALCAFNWVTRLPCPSCGFTRAWCSLSHFKVSESIAYHPLVIFTFGLYLLSFGLVLTDAARGTKFWEKMASSKFVCLSVAAVLIGAWLIRLAL